MALRRKPSIRIIRPLPVEAEFTPTERRDLRRRYKQAQQRSMRLEQLLNMPDPLDPRFGKDWRK